MLNYRPKGVLHRGQYTPGAHAPRAPRGGGARAQDVLARWWGSCAASGCLLPPHRGWPDGHATGPEHWPDYVTLEAIHNEIVSATGSSLVTKHRVAEFMHQLDLGRSKKTLKIPFRNKKNQVLTFENRTAYNLGRYRPISK